MNYFANGKGDGIVVIVLAVATAILAGKNLTRHVLWTGLASGAMILFTFIRFQNAKSEMQARMDELGDNPFRGLAELAAESVQMQWGWIVLIAGTGVTIYAGWKSRQDTPSGPVDAPPA